MPSAGCSPAQSSGACCLYRCASYCPWVCSHIKEAVNESGEGEAKKEMKISELYLKVSSVEGPFVSLTDPIALFLVNEQKMHCSGAYSKNMSRFKQEEKKEERRKEGRRQEGKEQWRGGGESVVMCNALGHK